MAKAFLSIFALILMGGSLSGCLAAAATAGGAAYVGADEATEDDGNFDPLENARGEGDGRN